jgi:ectoine hydroxylase-related dioxygenase (phytanoyl-CoA dioxygenase family)
MTAEQEEVMKDLSAPVGSDYMINTDDLVEHGGVQRYRRDGFIHLPQVLTTAEVAHYLAAAEQLLQREETITQGSDTATVLELVTDSQLKDERLRSLALHPRITRIAERLAGQRLRLFKQELLLKERGRCLPTGAHTDESAYPFTGEPVTLSAWVALVDVPLERGCMSFIAGSQRFPSTKGQEYRIGDDPAVRWPGSQWLPIVTIPVRAGDCTFHSARTIHMAEANETDTPRISTISVYMDRNATYSPIGNPHMDNIANTTGLRPGDPLDGTRFPLLTPVT